MIEVRDLTKHYGTVCAVDHISFTINQGEITGLLGPNGAGKTTTMRMITGYFPPTTGSISIKGVNVVEDPVAVKRMIGYLPESAPLYRDMIVYDYLKYIADIHQVDDPDRIRDTARQCGLLDMLHRNIGELSKGYRQRVGLAHAMIHDPEILILDEPTTGLDPNQIMEIRNLIKEIGRRKTVILSTHILPEVEATCERVIIIDKGHIAADNRTDELKSQHSESAGVSVKVKGPGYEELAAALRELEDVDNVQPIPDREDLTACLVGSPSEKDVRPAIFHLVKDRNWVLYEMNRAAGNLEQIFRDLTLGGE